MLTFFTSKKATLLNTIVIMAVELREKLRWCSDIQNGMDRIVEFFQTTSPYQDRFLFLISKFPKGVKLKDQKQKKFFDDFKEFLEDAGRCEFGWNRTKIGETPSPHNVWINMKMPYDEMFDTRNVAAHLSRRDNPKGEVDHMVREGAEGKWNETCLVENDFVNPFIKGNYKDLCRLLKEYGK